MAAFDQSQDEPLFHALRDLTDATQRAALLDAACKDDPELRRRMDALLAAQARADEFFDPGPKDPVLLRARSGAARIVSTDPAMEEPVEIALGRYKLRQKIGEGGCGVVYLAEQSEPVRRQVAIKLIKPGMDTSSVIARFQAERQALAMMDHPNIAQVYDAGTTELGRPYFVMELVRGTRITEYCDQHQLPTRERLELVVKVCHAVQHAHQKGIIHRDLKPSNILVTVNDGLAVPKVIDFGVAKAVDQRLTDKTVFTAFEQFIGTPAYVSPEQAEMTSVDVDTRSDIYSLGVLLYELLTGRTPFDVAALLKAGVDEMRRAIRERDPVRPSTRMSTLARDELNTAALNRRTNAPELIHFLRGDLDWVVMKCLEKDRIRRYETANALAMDLQRHLAHEPIVARPPARLYVFGKFARRHRTMLSAVAAIFVALVGGLVVALIGYRRALAAQVEAECQRSAALHAQSSANVARGQADDLITFMMQDLSPALEQYGRLPLLKGVAEQAGNYFEQLPPELRDASTERGQAAALEAQARVERALGNSKAQEAALRAAISLRQKLASEDPDSAVQLLFSEWTVTGLSGIQTAAEWETYVHGRISQFRKLRDEHPSNLAAKRGLAQALGLFSRAAAFYYNQPAEALAAALEARSLWSEILTLKPADTLARADYAESLSAVANAYYANGEIERSVREGEEAYAYAEAALKSDPENIRLLLAAATVAQNLSARLSNISMRRSRDAEQVARRFFRSLMERDPTNAAWRMSYAQAHTMEAQYLWADGQIEAARAALREFDLLLAQHGSPDLPTIRGAGVRLSLQLARAAARAGDSADCDAQLQNADARFESYHATLPENAVHRHQARAVWLHGRCYVAYERRYWEELERLARELIDEVALGLVYQPDDGELLLRRATARSLLGEALLKKEDPAAAMLVLRAAVSDFRAAPPALLRFTEPRDALAADAMERLALALVALGDSAQARGLLESALTVRDSLLATEPTLWCWRLELARTCAALAATLEPTNSDQAPRRRTLLDRAVGILTHSEAASRLTPSDRTLLGELARGIGTAQR